MIYSTATVPVNPPGELPLTREQVWTGLVLKARDARSFLPAGFCTRCTVVAEGDGFLMREAVILGNELTEIVTFAPQHKVSFHQVKSPQEGVIVNQILEDESGALLLRFYAYLGLVGAAPGSEQERAAQAALDSEERGYKAALLSTLARTRALAKEGALTLPPRA
ncbi:MAG TPA: AtaL-like protein [Kofleriaceae bacterium]|nr:AtaL-like protein [Kofleriaceae bacterium]